MDTAIGNDICRFLPRLQLITKPDNPNILGIYKHSLTDWDKELLLIGEDFTILDKMKYSCDIPGDYGYSAHCFGNRLFTTFGDRYGY